MFPRRVPPTPSPTKRPTEEMWFECRPRGGRFVNLWSLPSPQNPAGESGRNSQSGQGLRRGRSAYRPPDSSPGLLLSTHLKRAPRHGVRDMVPTVAPSPNGMVMKVLPGADRKRTPGLYCFRVTYRNPDGLEPGCVMTWEVSGGRTPYQ